MVSSTVCVSADELLLVFPFSVVCGFAPNRLQTRSQVAIRRRAAGWARLVVNVRGATIIIARASNAGFLSAIVTVGFAKPNGKQGSEHD